MPNSADEKLEVILNILNNIHDHFTHSDEFGEWVNVQAIKNVIFCNCDNGETLSHNIHDVECAIVKSV